MKLFRQQFLPILIFYLISPAAHGQVDWSFSIETPNFVVSQSESFSVIGRISNLSSSTSVLAIREPCSRCIIPVSIIIGYDPIALSLFAIETNVLDSVLPGLQLNPGDSFSFVAYKVHPIGAANPTGNYELLNTVLFIPEYGFRSAGPVKITLVPEPSNSALLLSGLGLLVIALRFRNIHHLQPAPNNRL